MIKRTTLFFCFLMALLLIGQGSAMAAPQGTLRVALTNMPNSLDLCYGADRQASNAGWRLYDSLVVVDDNGAVAPALAQSYLHWGFLAWMPLFFPGTAVKRKG